MNTINLKLEISLNGAQVFPTVAQYAKLQEAATNILLGGPQEEEAKEKRAYTRRAKVRQVWTQDEVNFVVNHRLEGKSYKKIAKELLTVFGTKRSVGNLATTYYVNRKTWIKPDPNALMPSNAPQLKQNEIGGLDELKSRELAA